MTPEKALEVQCMECGNVGIYTTSRAIEAIDHYVKEAVLKEREACAEIVKRLVDRPEPVLLEMEARKFKR